MGRLFVLDNNDNQKKIFKQDFYNKKPASCQHSQRSIPVPQHNIGLLC